MIEALNQAFPTVVTSGTILAAAGMSIGFLSSENTVASIGVCLGRGTLLSMVLVMCVLPQILLLGDSLVEKTSFTIGLHPAPQQLQGPCVSTDTFADISTATSMLRSMAVSTVRSAHRSISEMCRWRRLPAQTFARRQLHSEEGSDEET